MTFIKSKKRFVDAYGEQLWSYFETGEPRNEIIEPDDGSLSSGQYGVRKRVLDIGRGAGRHSLYLQRKVFDVTGIDNSPLTIAHLEIGWIG